jgi:hypothetical protein
MNGFDALLSELKDLSNVLVVSSNFILINEVMNSIPKNCDIQIVSNSIEWNSIEAKIVKWDLLIYFDAPELWDCEGNENLPRTLLKYANIVIGSFPSPASMSYSEVSHWPSRVIQLLKTEPNVNISTYMRKYFWDDEIVPIDFSQSLITYSVDFNLKFSDFPPDCIHPANIGLQKTNRNQEISKIKLRVRFVSKVSPSTRKQIKKFIPSTIFRRIRRWIRS